MSWAEWWVVRALRAYAGLVGLRLRWGRWARKAELVALLGHDLPDTGEIDTSWLEKEARR